MDVEDFYSLVFDGTLDEVFGGALDYIPDARIGFHVLETGVTYNVRVKPSASKEYIGKRKQGSAAALYATLYVLPESGKLHVKLGSHAFNYNTAGLIWSQAPLYTRVVGVFIFEREFNTEYLERGCRSILSKEKEFRRRNGEKVTVDTRSPDLKEMITMWMRVKDVKGRIKEYMSVVDEVAEKCFNGISLNAPRLGVKTLYGSDMWFHPPLHQLDVREGYVAGIREFIKRARGSEGAVNAELTVLPMGLCVLRASIKNLDNTAILYIDRCRSLSYSLSFSLKHT